MKFFEMGKSKQLIPVDSGQNRGRVFTGNKLTLRKGNKVFKGGSRFKQFAEGERNGILNRLKSQVKGANDLAAYRFIEWVKNNKPTLFDVTVSALPKKNRGLGDSSIDDFFSDLNVDLSLNGIISGITEITKAAESIEIAQAQSELQQEILNANKERIKNGQPPLNTGEVQAYMTDIAPTSVKADIAVDDATIKTTVDQVSQKLTDQLASFKKPVIYAGIGLLSLLGAKIFMGKKK